MKKIIHVAMMAVCLAVLGGCAARPAATPADTSSNSVSDRVVDISALNNQTVTTTPGDVLYLKLEGAADGKHQWNFAAQEAIDKLTLKDQKLSGFTPNQPGGKFTAEWWLQVQQTGNFRLQFDYAQYNKKAEKSFVVQVVSQ